MIDNNEIPFQGVTRAGIGAALAIAACSVGAQAIETPATCSFNLDYATAPVPPAPVPSLSMVGIAVLMLVIGFLAWRRGRFPGARLMATVFVAAAAMLANQGGGGLIQQAYAAAISITLSNPSGGSVAGTVTRNGDVLTITNATGVPLQIGHFSSTWPGAAAPTLGHCAAGVTLAAGASCTATVAGCNTCTRPSIYNNGSCITCSGGTAWNPTTAACERICVPGAPGC